MKKIFFLLSILATSIASAQCCTIVYSFDGNKAYIGNNEDFLNTTHAKIWFEPAGKNQYGAAFWGFDYMVFKARWIPQGGINEHGLFFDRTAVPEAELVKDSSKKNAGPFFLNRVLKECKSVDEAIILISQYNLKFFAKGQILFADASGNYAIVENNKITPKERSYTVITNFRVSDPGLGGFPSTKYQGAMRMLESNPQASMANFERILHEVSETGIEFSTIYSQICDLSSGIINLYHFQDYKNPVKFDLKTELKKGKHSYLVADLFRPRKTTEMIDILYEKGIDSCFRYLDHLKASSSVPLESELLYVANTIQKGYLTSCLPAFCDKIIDFYPHCDKVMVLKGKYLLSQGETEEGFELIKKAFVINPDNYRAVTICQHLNGNELKGNAVFILKGFQNAKVVALCLGNENWENYLHMMQKKDGYWRCTLDLYPGDYQYIYKVDGRYVIDAEVNELIEYSTSQVMVFHQE